MTRYHGGITSRYRILPKAFRLFQHFLVLFRTFYQLQLAESANKASESTSLLQWTRFDLSLVSKVLAYVDPPVPGVEAWPKNRLRKDQRILFGSSRSSPRDVVWISLVFGGQRRQ